jgi:hypothetical protein
MPLKENLTLITGIHTAKRNKLHETEREAERNGKKSLIK